MSLNGVMGKITRSDGVYCHSYRPRQLRHAWHEGISAEGSPPPCWPVRMVVRSFS